MRLTGICSIAVFASGLANSAQGPTFDAASVKLSTERPLSYTTTGGPGTNDPGRFHAPRIAMSALLARAFDVGTDQIAGPAWLRGVVSINYYAIDATMPSDTTKEQFQKMLQNLLAERFHLVWHRESRTFPGYALIVDKGGPKVKEAPPNKDAIPDTTPEPRTMASTPRGDDGFPDVPGPHTITMGDSSGQTRVKYQERTMGEFASSLGFIIARSQGRGLLDNSPQPRVVDETGLAGKYTFILEYYNAAAGDANASLLARPESQPGSGPLPSVGESGGGGLDVFTAIRKQLGLRLEKKADVPLGMIVVENVDKVPTSN
jgi:uncharacterized protein (TIGR03435 family)